MNRQGMHGNGYNPSVFAGTIACLIAPSATRMASRLMHAPRLLFKAGIAGVVVIAMIGIWLVLRELGMPDSLAPRAIAQWLNGHDPLGPALLVLTMILAVVVGPIPTLPISAAAGLAYGVVHGTVIAVAGALAGAMIAFYVARLLGREAVRARQPHNPVFASGGCQRFLFIAVLLMRLVPVFSFALISYAAGVTAIHAWRFALATTLGMVPMTLVFTSLGQRIEINPALSVTASVLILVAMALLPVYLGRRPRSRLARWLQLHPES